jgi:hypothetical protein
VLVASAWGSAVGPNCTRPEVIEPPANRGLPADHSDNSDSTSFGDQKWWETFHDETLQRLIRTALQHNYDGRIAATRILEARRAAWHHRADQFPDVSAGCPYHKVGLVADQCVPPREVRPPPPSICCAGCHTPMSSRRLLFVLVILAHESWAKTTKTNRIRQVSVGTEKKSMATVEPTWFSRNVRQVCEGGVRRRGISREIVRSDTSNPSFNNSP